MSSPTTPRRATRANDRLALASVVALSCALWLSPAQQAHAAAGSPCAPSVAAPGQSVASAARADGGSELTQFAPDGGYKVTRCGKGGGLVASQTVSPIVAPGGASVLVPTEREEAGVKVAMLYGDPSEATWAAAFQADRAAIAASVIAPTVRPAVPPVAQDPGPVDAGTPAAGAGSQGASKDSGSSAAKDAVQKGRDEQIAVAAVAGDACTNGQYNFWGSSWPIRDYSYYVNRGRFNWNDTSVSSIVSGHNNWDTTYNSCGFNDVTTLDSHHVGSTTGTIHTYPDGASITDKGSVSSICPGALACTWNFTDASGRTSETDQRYNENITFTNVGAAGAYDYQSISTHETGHSIGLDHANSSDALTMYYQTTAGSTYLRSLARGDVLGMRARYP